MTTLEVTISDDSKASFILSLLKEFRYISIGKIQKENKEIKTEGSLDFDKFDDETQHRIKAHFDAKKLDKTLKTRSLEQQDITFPSTQQRLENAAMLLLTDYENDGELTNLTSIDSDDFYEYETK
jgi:hypothetical protein